MLRFGSRYEGERCGLDNVDIQVHNQGMVLPQTVEYALRAAVWLASCEEGQTAGRIAAATKVPVSYLLKVLQSLSRAGLVRAKRGVRGGFVLARAASEISLLDVLSAIEPMRRIDRCPLGVGAHAGALCPLHRRLDAATEQMERAFRETSLAALLVPDEALSPLCTIPRKRLMAGALSRRPNVHGVSLVPSLHCGIPLPDRAESRSAPGLRRKGK